MWLANIFNKLRCISQGHLYRPMYEVEQRWFTYTGSKRNHKGSRVRSKTFVRYTCECCEEKTEWMGKEKHKQFELSACPTWGDRGSDSQNYRGKEVYDVRDLD